MTAAEAAIRIRVAWEGGALVFCGGLGQFLAENGFGEEEEAAILGALAIGRPYQTGGGAAPLVTIMPAESAEAEDADDIDESEEPPCTEPAGHEWSSGIDEDTDREIPIRCIHCGASGDI